MASPKVVAAAHVAASWVRARRATWAEPGAPLPAVPVQPPDAPVLTATSPAPAAAPARAATSSAATPAPARSPTPSASAATPVQSVTPPPTVSADAAAAQGRPSTPARPAAKPELAAPPPPARTPVPPPQPVVDTSAPPELPPEISLTLAADVGAAKPSTARTAKHVSGSHAADRDSSSGSAIGRWLPHVAALLALAAVVYAGGRFALNRIQTSRATETATPSRPGPGAPTAAPAPAPERASGGSTIGTVHVTSTPPGAQVLLDGKARGVTPLTLTDVSAGTHALQLTSADGTIRRSVTVTDGRTTEVAESIFSGWVAIRAPFDLSITEGSRVLRADDRGQVLLSPGAHELRLVNRALAYDQVHHVEVKPGEIATLSIAPPRSTLSVTASEPAEVWIDGTRVGDTPLTDAPIDIGTREIVVKRASGGAERKFTVTVTTKPYTLNVNF